VVIELIRECTADILRTEQAKRDTRVAKPNIFGLLKLKDTL